MAANPYTSQLRSFSSGTSNARRGLKELYKERRKAVVSDYRYQTKLHEDAWKTANKDYGTSIGKLGVFDTQGQQMVDAGGYGGRYGGGENARRDPAIATLLKSGSDPYRTYLGTERKAEHALYHGLKGAAQYEDKTLKTGLLREEPLALSELEQGIVDTQSNLQTQANDFAQQQAYNASMQAYMAQSLSFQKQMAQGSQGGVGGGSTNRLTPNAAQWSKYAQKTWGVTVGGWRAHGSVPNSDHPKGLAIDIMSSGQFGQNIANEFVGQSSNRGVSYVIYNHRIWTPSQGWHAYHGPNPHTDHVHVSFLY